MSRETYHHYYHHHRCYFFFFPLLFRCCSCVSTFTATSSDFALSSGLQAPLPPLTRNIRLDFGLGDVEIYFTKNSVTPWTVASGILPIWLQVAPAVICDHPTHWLAPAVICGHLTYLAACSSSSYLYPSTNIFDIPNTTCLSSSRVVDPSCCFCSEHIS